MRRDEYQYGEVTMSYNLILHSSTDNQCPFPLRLHPWLPCWHPHELPLRWDIGMEPLALEDSKPRQMLGNMFTSADRSYQSTIYGRTLESSLASVHRVAEVSTCDRHKDKVRMCVLRFPGREWQGQIVKQIENDYKKKGGGEGGGGGLY